MRTRRLIIAMLVAMLPTVTTLAVEAKPKTSDVLSLAPADAIAVLYLRSPAELLRHPLLVDVVDEDGMNTVLAPAAEAFSGPTMVALCGTPMNPASIRVEIATRPAIPDEVFFEKLAKQVLPGLGQWTEYGSGGIGTSGRFRTIRLPGPLPLVLYAASRNGVVYASGRQSTVQLWLEQDEIPERFVGSDDHARLLDEKSAPPDVLIYFNGRPLVPLAGMAFDRHTMPGMFANLGLDRFESAALTARWSGSRLRARLALAVSEGEGVVPELLAPGNSPSTITSLLPEDYTFFARGAWSNAAETCDNVNSLLELLDPEIVVEFETECREFRNEFGFDPRDDFLSNLVDEWIVGGRVDPQGGFTWIAASRLEDAATFDSQLATLQAAFQLRFEYRRYREVLVQSTPGDCHLRFSIARLGKHLVLARDADAMCDAVDAWIDKTGLQTAATLQPVARHLPSQSSRTAFVNLSRLFAALSEVIPDDDAWDGADIVRRIADAKATTGLSVSRGDGLIAVDVVLNHGVDKTVMADLWSTFAFSVKQSREMARRQVSAANIKGIVQSCMIHANRNKGAWPNVLSDLVRDGSCVVRQFASPYDDQAAALTVENLDRESIYLYRPGKGLGPTDVVVCERNLRGGGADFGFADGHVAWITGSEAEQLVGNMRRLAN